MTTKVTRASHQPDGEGTISTTINKVAEPKMKQELIRLVIGDFHRRQRITVTLTSPGLIVPPQRFVARSAVAARQQQH